jgi:hypothetical protein
MTAICLKPFSASLYYLSFWNVLFSDSLDNFYILDFQTLTKFRIEFRDQPTCTWFWYFSSARQFRFESSVCDLNLSNFQSLIFDCFSFMKRSETVCISQGTFSGESEILVSQMKQRSIERIHRSRFLSRRKFLQFSFSHTAMFLRGS